jgi:hypothetical protein
MTRIQPGHYSKQAYSPHNQASDYFSAVLGDPQR